MAYEPIPSRFGAVESGQAAALSSVAAPLLGRALELISLLQTSLDPQRVIEIFARELRASVPFEGLRYHNAELNLLLQIDQSAAHTCSYKLTLENELLGELQLWRRQRFSPADLAALEHLLCSLIYPLRNALAHQKLLNHAQLDPLTQVRNRSSLDADLEREVRLAQRHATTFSLIIMDLDHFKRINDTYGHVVGDRVLKTFTRRVGNCIRNTDLLYRFGGEEFVVLLPNTPLVGAQELAERIRHAVGENPITHGELEIALTVSLGVGALASAEGAERLFDRADAALYEAKREGRNRTIVAA